MSTPHLTPDQILRVAVAHILNGVDQHVLAELLGSNQGRINEAVKAVEWTLSNHRTAHKLAMGRAHVNFQNGNGEESQ